MREVGLHGVAFPYDRGLVPPAVEGPLDPDPLLHDNEGVEVGVGGQLLACPGSERHHSEKPLAHNVEGPGYRASGFGRQAKLRKGQTPHAEVVQGEPVLLGDFPKAQVQARIDTDDEPAPGELLAFLRVGSIKFYS